jgi:UDP-3-O-[3-hydroxymyristoyl] glucosamine N-acyltransferase
MTHTLSDIAEAVGARVEGAADFLVRRAAHPTEAGPDDLAIAFDAEHEAMLATSAARVAMLADGADWRELGLVGAVLATRPRYALAGVTERFARPPDAPDGVHPTAIIDPSADVAPDARIAPFAVIGANASIGARTVIEAHVVIGPDSTLDEDCLIRAGCRIGAGVRIGKRVILQPNVCVGYDGFSYVTPQPGAVESVAATGRVAEDARNMRFARIASLGAVTLGDDVEIGASTTIDAGTLTDTRIGAGTKIDNQVQIGHNCRIGTNCLLCGQVGLAGSVVLGDRVVLGGKAGVADHVELGSDVVVGAQSGVAVNAPSGSVLLGSPATSREEALKIILATRRLPRLIETINAVKKRLSALELSR